MTPEQMENCSDLDVLLSESETVYQDCARYNNCSICPHDTVNNLCNLMLFTRQIKKLSKEILERRSK